VVVVVVEKTAAKQRPERYSVSGRGWLEKAVYVFVHDHLRAEFLLSEKDWGQPLWAAKRAFPAGFVSFSPGKGWGRTLIPETGHRRPG
jgi:hypothetical protein